MNRFSIAAAIFLLGGPLLLSDIPSAGTPDLDAAFARAADLLEAGKRAEAELALDAIRARTEERSWEARIGFLLASDDLRRKDYPAAVRRLRLAPASAIGLEPYRRAMLARALAAAGLNSEAAREARAAFETEEPFAGRFAAGRALASALEKTGDRGGAL